MMSHENQVHREAKLANPFTLRNWILTVVGIVVGGVLTIIAADGLMTVKNTYTSVIEIRKDQQLAKTEMDTFKADANKSIEQLQADVRSAIKRPEFEKFQSELKSDLKAAFGGEFDGYVSPPNKNGSPHSQK